jgi:hypothetical protein
MFIFSLPLFVGCIKTYDSSPDIKSYSESDQINIE